MTPSSDTSVHAQLAADAPDVAAAAAADERPGRRRSETLAQAAGRFWRFPSPWIITTMLVTVTAARIIVGGWHRSDLILAAVLLALQPMTEWLIHVLILHFRPREVGGVTLDPLLARKHREHHADPTRPDLIFIPTPVYLWLIPGMLAIALLAFPRTGLGLTWLMTMAAIGIVYEWSHFLVHSDVRPRSRLFRAIWRQHRLHHYKNEHYWFSISATWPDRLLGTKPEPADVPTSPTVKALHATTDVG